MFPLHLYWLCFLYFFQSKLIKSDFHLVLFQPTRLSIIFWKQIFTEGSSGSSLFVHSANSSINPDNFLLLIFIVFAKRKMSHYINIRPINFYQTSVKLLEKIGIYYQLTNPWKKKKIQNEPVTGFKQNKNMKELIGSNKSKSNIVSKINKTTLKPGKCYPSFGNRILCCNQVTRTSKDSNQKSCKIFQFVTICQLF